MTRSSPRLIRSRHELFDRTRGFYPLLSLPEPLTAVDTCAACDPACCPAPSAEGAVRHTTPSAPQAPSTGAKLRKGTRNPSVASRDSPVSQGSTSKKCRGSKKGRYGSGQGIWTAVLESGPWTAAPGAQRCSGGRRLEPGQQVTLVASLGSALGPRPSSTSLAGSQVAERGLGHPPRWQTEAARPRGARRT